MQQAVKSTSTRSQHSGARGYCRRATYLTAALLAVLLPEPPLAGQVNPTIWVSPLDSHWRRTWNFPANDWDELFEPAAPWASVASHVHVFELSKRFVSEADDTEMRRVVTFLKDNKIKLALQGTPLVATQACGLGVEGHGPAADMAQEAARIRSAGGDLAYVSMDEPLFYGRFLRYFKWRGARKTCDYPIKDLAAQTAGKIAQVRAIFPAVVVGDTEPFGIPPSYSAEWNAGLAEWIDAYKSATGQVLSFLQADLVWSTPTWKSDFLEGAAIARSKSIPMGIIYNASPKDRNWTALAASHYRLIEGELKVVPAQAVFKTWTDYPRRMLPESDRSTFSGLVHEYLNWRRLD
jgi:hypothetical protein